MVSLPLPNLCPVAELSLAIPCSGPSRSPGPCSARPLGRKDTSWPTHWSHFTQAPAAPRWSFPHPRTNHLHNGFPQNQHLTPQGQTPGSPILPCLSGALTCSLLLWISNGALSRLSAWNPSALALPLLPTTRGLWPVFLDLILRASLPRCRCPPVCNPSPSPYCYFSNYVLDTTAQVMCLHPKSSLSKHKLTVFLPKQDP